MTTTPTLTLTAFLEARIAAEEAVARAAGSLGAGLHWWVDGPAKVSGKWWVYSTGEKFDHQHTADHIARFDPARVLAECEAKRRIVARHTDLGRVVEDATADEGLRLTSGGECAECHHLTAPCPTLRDLAAVYSDHADYNPDWA